MCIRAISMARAERIALFNTILKRDRKSLIIIIRILLLKNNLVSRIFESRQEGSVHKVSVTFTVS